MLNEISKKKKLSISFEIFPPKKNDDIMPLYKTIEDLKELNPDFVSVTYGAGGSTRDKTVEIASHIKNEIGIETVAHLTCVNSTKDDIQKTLNDLKENNINNILALRGDPPQGQDNFTKTIGGLSYASELTEFIKKEGDFSVAVAGYPEGHLEAQSLDEDVKFLKEKVDKGADMIITQLFFDNNDFFIFKEKCRKIGITIPIVVGVLPVLNFKSLQKISELSGAKIPKNFYNELKEHADDKNKIEEIGIEYAIKQIRELIDGGVDGIHFYTMNKSQQIKKIYNNVKDKINNKI